MLTKRYVMVLTTRGALVAALAWLVIAALRPAAVSAQLPLQAMGSPFEMTGFIQSATLDGGTDPFRGGTITLNNHLVIVPRNTIFQMPATSLTWAELFTNAPAPYAALGQTGLALNDTPKPLTTFEVGVQGNRVEPGGAYIAGLIFLDQLSLMTHQGFINFINYATGDIYMGGPLNTAAGTRVRINDPIGRFGRVMTHDARFTIDEDNPTIKTETGYPMCIPRVDPAAADDPLCPNGNRPIDTTGAPQAIFTMPPAPVPTPAERANPALRPVPLGGDPWRMAPLKVGDYITAKGPLVADLAGSRYLSVWGIDANVGIFTTPGTLPAYVAIDVLLMGTGPTADPVIAQEGAKRTRVEGFTTDISTAISVNAVDVDECSGVETDRNWTIQAVDPGPPGGAVAGRWRFRPGAPLFNLKGFPFLPPTRELHAFSINGSVLTLNGLSAGEYTAPIFEFILPENRGIGNPKVPANFEGMNFLAQGSGPRDAFMSNPPVSIGVVRQLSPWPGQTAPVLKACPVPPIANAGPDQTVASASLVALNGSLSSDPNVPPLPLTFAWTQLSGPAVAITNPTGAIAGFRAPTVPTGSPAVTLTFQLAVSNTKFTATDTVSIRVNPAPADTVRPVTTGLTSTPPSPVAATTVTMRLTVTATDNVGVTSVTFARNGATIGAVQTAPTVAGGSSYTVTFPKPPASAVVLGTTIPTVFTATARDAAGNVSVPATISVVVR